MEWIDPNESREKLVERSTIKCIYVSETMMTVFVNATEKERWYELAWRHSGTSTEFRKQNTKKITTGMLWNEKKTKIKTDKQSDLEKMEVTVNLQEGYSLLNHWIDTVR